MEPLWAFAGLKPASIAFAASFQKRKLSFGCGNGCHCEGVQERFPVINLPRERAVLSWGQSLEVATRRRAGGPSPCSPPPPGRPRATQCSARRRVRHKQTQFGHTWTAEQLRPATDRGLRSPGLRKQNRRGGQKSAPSSSSAPVTATSLRSRPMAPRRPPPLPPLPSEGPRRSG